MTPLVGVGVTILRNDQVLLGKRRGAHGPGEYRLPRPLFEMTRRAIEGLETRRACFDAEDS